MSRLYLSNFHDDILNYSLGLGTDTLAFESKLAGKTVLVTRANPFPEEADPLIQRLKDVAAVAIRQPAIQLSLTTELGIAKRTLDQLAQYESLVFVSSNGVRFFEQLTHELDIDWRPQQETLQLVAIGQGTASSMRGIGMNQVAVCPNSNSSSLAGWLTEKIPFPYLVIRADRGSHVLSDALNELGLPFTELAIYRSLDVSAPNPAIVAKMRKKELDWVTLTSSAIAHSVIRMFGDDLKLTKIATIGPQVSAIVRASQLEVIAEAAQPNFPALVEAMLVWNTRR